jgi:hypothetical protein
VDPGLPFVVIDAGGNVIAECGDSGASSMSRDERIRMRRDGALIAAELVRVLNAWLYGDAIGEHPPRERMQLIIEEDN